MTPRLTHRCAHVYPANPGASKWVDYAAVPRRCKSAVALGSRYCPRHDEVERLVKLLVPVETRPLWRRALEARGSMS